ncbi:MAG: histidine phosphatase family protein [Anaerolineaceae bacterium]
MAILLLIRHGENDFVGKRLAGHLPDVHLNEKGRHQADALIPILGSQPIRAIYSSPLERAVETAEPLANHLGLTIQICDNLAEINFGDWQGCPIDQLRKSKEWETVQNHPEEMRFPGGESFSEAQMRLVTAVDGIAASHDKKEMVACFSHSDSIKLLVAHYLGMPLKHFQRLTVDTASISAVYLGVSHPYLLQLNGKDLSVMPWDES